MANRYWVGGTAAWDGTAGSKWALTSGGAGGQAIPTSADDVFFDAASGAVTCTVGATVSCLNLNFTGFTGTFNQGNGINASGGLTCSSTMTVSSSTNINFFSTVAGNTITTAGKTWSGFTFAGVGGVYTLGDALTLTGAITVTQGTFTTNNFNVTASSLSSSNSNTRTINLGSSTVTLTANSSGVIAFNITTNLTLNAGTSTIIISDTIGSGINIGISGGPALTFNNITFSGAGSGGTHSIAGAVATNPSITVNNLAVAAPATAGVRQLTFAGSCVINGTLSTTGTAGNRRVWFRGATYGIAQTLTINSAPSLTDADFRDIYVIGTAAPISGTRIGNLRGCSGITFDTAKTVYWVTLAGGNWSGTNWAATSGGAASDNNFPLAQDTAVIENTGLNTSATVTLDTAIVNLSGINMSTRTNAMTIANASAPSIYGDLTAGNGVTFSTSNAFAFAGRNTQTLTSSGRTIGWDISVSSYGGTLQLADALNMGSNTLYVITGTFDTKNFSVTAGGLSSNNSNVRAITLGSSTVTFSISNAFTTADTTNLTFNAGTSQINFSNNVPTVSGGTGSGAGLSFYNVSFTGTGAGTRSLTGANTFNNFTVSAPASAGLVIFALSANQTINSTLTVAGATAVQRIFVQSDTLGTTRTITANALTATDCDFRDITIAGAAAGSSPTRAGNCGGNTGITFPGAKTVYWNLAGIQDWTSTAWALSSGGTPDINNYPLPQDTAVFDDAVGSVTGTIAITRSLNMSAVDMSARTSAMTFTVGSGNSPNVYGDWKWGTGVSSTSTSATLQFVKRGTQTITCNGVTFGCNVTVDCVTGTVQLADALTLTAARTFTLTSGTFDAVTYNVTTGLVSLLNGTLKMGSGTWTLSGTGAVWTNQGLVTSLYKGTANIVLSDTSASARTFAGNSISYNKLTIGGTTGTSTTTINGNNQFTELASTKTVAHTISSTQAQTIGAWTVTGTAGNVVTIAGTSTITIAGARVSGVDYLALGTTTISATSPGEFYAGANSTGGTNAILTAAPAAVTRYWRGGSGTWDATTTTNWASTSGGAGPASVPTSADAVVFDTLSNATAYTVTCTATQLRCAALTMAGPAVGNVTWAGTAPLAIHGNVSLAATGITRTYVGSISLTGSSTGRTFTTNGVTTAGIIVNGVGCEWTLGSGLNAAGSNFTLTNGSFDTAGYAVTCLGFSSQNTNSRTLTLGATTWTISQQSGAFAVNSPNFTFNVGTSTFTFTSTGPQLLVDSGTGPLTFYTASFTNTAIGTVSFNGSFTFTNLTFAGRVSSGIGIISLSANQTINGTLTISAGTDATMRNFLQSDTLGTTRTLTCAAFAGTDADFRDITIAGAAAPVSGTRLGDCKGNSGITFVTGVNKYWNLAGSNNWSATAWATSAGGAVAVNNFPLAQDTAIFTSTVPATGTTTTINASYNLGTIDMSARTSNTMTLAQGSITSALYGDFIVGTGISFTGTPVYTFSGRGTQQITSAGKQLRQLIINSPGGSVVLQDALDIQTGASGALTITSGTFNANGFNVTLSNAANSSVSSSNTNVRTIAIGSGTWTIVGNNGWTTSTSTNLTVTGTGTISLTSASAKTFAGGDSTQYSGITLNQGGAGALTITGNNTFKDITNTYKTTGATNITLGTTTQTVSQFTAAGEAGRVLTIQGTSASSPSTLVLTGATKPNVDYLAITGVRAYSLTDTWYAGANSTNNGSLGWLFTSGSTLSIILESGSGADSITAALVFSASISEAASGIDSILGGFAFDSSVAEAASGIDSQSNLGTFTLTVLETASGLDSVFPSGTFSISVAEAASGVDSVSGLNSILSSISEAASGIDSTDKNLAYSGFISELAAGLDGVFPSGTFGISVLESASGEDSVVSFAIVNNTISEAASGIDVQSVDITFTLSVSETASGLDALIPTVLVTAIINEAASALEALGIGGTFNIAVSEVASAQDQVTNIGTFNIAITETATGTDVLTARLLWEPIDDSQTANWTTINTTQTPTWTDITNTQSPGWTDIPTQ